METNFCNLRFEKSPPLILKCVIWQDFDFNRLFKDGISYLRPAELGNDQYSDVLGVSGSISMMNVDLDPGKKNQPSKSTIST